MSDAAASMAVPAAAPPAKSSWWSRLTTTDDGCRWEIRLAGLLMLAAVFLWNFAGPALSVKVWWLGVPLLLVGVPLQAWQAGSGRPGYPWKLGLCLALFGALMWPDVTYRQFAGGPVLVQETAPLLLIPGVWMLLWWPVARQRAKAFARRSEEA